MHAEKSNKQTKRKIAKQNKKGKNVSNYQPLRRP